MTLEHTSLREVKQTAQTAAFTISGVISDATELLIITKLNGKLFQIKNGIRGEWSRIWIKLESTVSNLRFIGGIVRKMVSVGTFPTEKDG